MIAPAVAVAGFPRVERGRRRAADVRRVTTFNSLRNAGARPGDLVAVLGIGGLGHLGVQFAAKAGYRTWPSRGARTRSRWRASSERITTSTAESQDPAAELTRLGGARGHPGHGDERQGDDRDLGGLAWTESW
jgi:hypothetical protein